MTAEQLGKELTTGGADQRSAAAQTLSRMGESAAPAAVALAKSTGDEHVGEWCVAALEDLGAPPASLTADLASLLSADDEACAYWAATLLGRLDADASPAVGALTRAAKDHSALTVRERAVWALGKVGPAAAEASATLEQLAAGDQPRLARLAKQSLESVRG